MTSITYTEVNIDDLLDFIGKAWTGLNSEINKTTLVMLDVNYNSYSDEINSYWTRFKKFIKNPFYYKREFPITLEEYQTLHYEREFNYYSRGRLERIDAINEMAIQAKLSKIEFVLTLDDYRYLFSFIR